MRCRATPMARFSRLRSGPKVTHGGNGMHPVSLLAGLLAALACLNPFAQLAAAEPFPSRTVKFVVPQAPGGATDVFARKFAQALSEKWGQPVIVENRAAWSAPTQSRNPRRTATRC